VARSPADIVGLIRWSRADDYAATGDGNQFTSGTVADRANATTLWAPGTAGSGPMYHASLATLGNRPTLEFDGTYTDALAESVTTTDLPGTGFSAWAVALRASTGGGTTPALLSEDTIINPNRVMQLGYGNASNLQARMVAFATSTGTTRIDTELTTSPKATAVVVTGVATTTSSEAFVNGTSTAGPTTTPTGLYVITGRRLIVGAAETTSNTYGFAGHIAEWGVYDHPLTAAERATLHSYVQDRYGITVADYVAAPTTSAGTGTGTWTFASAAVGRRVPKATAAGTWTFAGAGIGRSTPKATGAGTWTFNGVGIGRRVPKATGAGTWTFAGAAVGVRPVVGVKQGSGAGAWTFAGAAVGRRVPKATGAGTWTFAGAATGRRTPKATAAGSWTFVGAGVGRRVPKATGAGTWTFAGAAVGAAPIPIPPPGVNGIPNITQGGTVTASTTTTAGTAVHRFPVTIAGDWATMWAPDTALNSTTITLVMAAHGAGGTEDWADANTGSQGILRQHLNDAGYVVLSQKMHGDQFGNTTAQTDLTNGINWAEGVTGWTVKHVLLWGESMGGGAMAAAYARKSVPNVRAAFLAAPLLDYTYEPPNADPTLKSALYAAYGVAADGSDLATKTAGFSPMSRDAADYTGIRVLISSSSQDPTVTQTQNAIAWINKITPVANDIYDYRTTGGHVSAQHYPQTEIVTYFNEAIALAESVNIAKGFWNFNGAAIGRRTPKATAGGSWVFAGAATGRRAPQATAGGTWTFAGAAVGVRPVVGAKQGTGVGAWAFASTAIGRRTPKATAGGSWVFAGAAVGRRTPKAAATSVWAFVGAGAGRRVPKATAIGSWAFLGVSQGRRVPKATATGAWVFVGRAVGTSTTVVVTFRHVGISADVVSRGIVAELVSSGNISGGAVSGGIVAEPVSSGIITAEIVTRGIDAVVDRS
jgi:hypothetical protein